ncbi:MAG: ZPR1 zinc finger domain-containing protein [Nanoarchaeota archaeon]
MEELKNQSCPVCHSNSLTLSQDEKDVPHFGKTLLFSMSCSSCGYHKGDVESIEKKEPAKYTFTIENEKDLKVHVIKSSEAVVRAPQLKMEVTPGPASDGYYSTVEGVLDKFKKVIESERDTAEDDEVKKHAKNLLKKLWKVSLGEMPLKIIIEDPSGNSAILSDKAVVEKLKVKN